MRLPHALSHRFAAAPPRPRALLVAGAGAAALLAALAEEPVATVGRLGLAGLALGAAGWALRRRARPLVPRAAIEVLELRPLGRDASVALLAVRGRALLVGFGAGGVRLLSDLGSDGPVPGEEAR